MVVSGAILQLSAVGAQNAYVTGIDYTLFKSGIKAYTNFSVAQTLINQQGNPLNEYYGNTVRFKIPRSGGDLMYKTYLTFILEGVYLDQTDPGYVPGSDVAFTEDPGHATIDYVQLMIGGAAFDRMNADQLDIQSELVNPVGKETYAFTGQSSAIGGATENLTNSKSARRILIPLPFWFHNNVSQCLPLVALMFMDVEIEVKFRNLDDIVVHVPSNGDPLTTASDTPGAPVPVTHPAYLPQGDAGAAGSLITYPVTFSAAPNVSPESAIRGGRMYQPQLLVSFVYLDQMERRLFAGSGHEYVISLHGFMGSEAKLAQAHQRVRKTMRNPVSEINMFVRRDNTVGTRYARQWFDYTGLPKDTRYNAPFGGTSSPINKYQQSVANLNDYPVEHWQLRLNNHERFVPQENFSVNYYRHVVPQETHSKIPTTDFFSYVFAVKPELLEANGSLNASRIDDIVFEFVFPQFLEAARIYIYYNFWNVIKISSGLAGVRFS